MKGPTCRSRAFAVVRNVWAGFNVLALFYFLQVFHAELERSVATLESADVASPAQVSIAVPNEKSWVLENKLADINERYSR